MDDKLGDRKRRKRKKNRVKARWRRRRRDPEMAKTEEERGNFLVRNNTDARTTEPMARGTERWKEGRTEAWRVKEMNEETRTGTRLLRTRVKSRRRAA